MTCCEGPRSRCFSVLRHCFLFIRPIIRYRCCIHSQTQIESFARDRLSSSTFSQSSSVPRGK